MAVSNVDLAMTMPGDMNKATCAGQIACGQACILSPKPGVTLQQCGMMCAAPLTGQAQADFIKLVTCILTTCTNDGGAFSQVCAGQAIAKGGACFNDVATCSAE